MALFPPGKGGGEEIAYGGKGKGVLIHTLPCWQWNATSYSRRQETGGSYAEGRTITIPSIHASHDVLKDVTTAITIQLPPMVTRENKYYLYLTK
ncbi:MAG: hypothetical protein V7K47_16160 [Nostoc sp.]